MDKKDRTNQGELFWQKVYMFFLRYLYININQKTIVPVHLFYAAVKFVK